METVATQNGAVMTTIGVGSVFFALALLVAVINVVSGLLNREFRETSRSAAAASGSGNIAATAGTATAGAAATGAASPDRAETQAARSDDRHERHLRVALAAFAVHRERSVRVRTPEPVSAWGTGARLHQLR